MSVASPGGLLERGESVAALNAILADVRSSSAGRLVLVAGEAGAGKTSLLRSFCDAHGEVRVLWGACEPLRTPHPLGAVVDVADTLGGALRELVAAGARPYEVAAALLDDLHSARPTVLVLEDVHWADEATLDVITLLATRIGTVPALVLCSYRDDELVRSDQLRFVLGELVRRRDRLKVEPLSLAAVAELAGPHGLDGKELYRSTGGNPFFVTEVLATGRTDIPETVRDAVIARASRLGVDARAMLEAVAVVPGQVELWLLEALAGDLGERLDTCLASGMLSTGRADVAFRHELARQAIEEAIAPHRRLALHRTAIQALAQRGGAKPDYARLAHHAEAAGDADSVLRWAPHAAGRAAASGAHREAAAQYARALRFADDLPPKARAELLHGRVQECWLSAQFAEAIAAQQSELDCHRELGDRRGEGDALRSLSRLLFFMGRTQEGEPLAMEAVRLLEQLPPGHDLAMAYGNVSQRRMVVQDYDETVAWGNRALELARKLDDTEALVYALINVGAAELDADVPGGRAHLEHALALARQEGLEDYAGRAITLLVSAGVRHRDFELADAYLDSGLEFCTERGLDTWRGYLIAHRARLELDRGRWDEAGESAALVLRDPRNPPVARVWALPTRGALRARRGDPGASAPIEEARALAESTGELKQIVPAAAAAAELGWLRGDRATVEQATDAALSLALDRRAPWAAGELAYWRWQAGVRDEVPGAALAAPYRLAMSGEALRAAELWHKLGCPYETALAMAESGDGGAMHQSVDQLRRLGARPAEAIIARRLRERGVRGVPRGPRPTTRGNPYGLTARELEVLASLGEGLRNSEIAERLVVSEKTVDHHVSAILRKLGVRTRAHASAEAVRLGLTDPS